MDLLSPVSDDEREDGEIVDDDLEDISDYSIPSSGKSDYSESIIRAISLSSISGTEDGRREYSERKVLLTAARRIHARSHSRRKSTTSSVVRKRRRDAGSRRRKRRRKASYSRSASLSSDSDGSFDQHVMDRRTLRQLNKAVRIETNAQEESSHISLKDRLKRMIQPDIIDYNISIDSPGKEMTPEEIPRTLDETFDKELEELRVQALKSAMLKKHMERKKRKEALKLSAEGAHLEQNNSNDKENENENENIAVTINPETKTIEIVNKPSDNLPLPEITPEEDLDIMRAMLLASMSQKITTENPSLPNLTLPNTLTNSLSLSARSSPIPQESSEKPSEKKKFTSYSLPPVKPLIIRVNPDSESDTTDFEYDHDNNTNENHNKMETSVEEFLRKQREQFEAKLSQSESKESSLDKSFLKLLPQSQQQEYKLLRQKLLQAKTMGVKNKPKDAKETSTSKSAVTKGNQEHTTRKEKKERLQPKGKYRELAPLVRKIHAETAAQRKQEAEIQRLQEQLKAARTQQQFHQRRHAVLVAQLKKARAIVDLRWLKLAKAKSLAEKSKDTSSFQPIPTKIDAIDVEIPNNNNVKLEDPIPKSVQDVEPTEMSAIENKAQNEDEKDVKSSTMINVEVDVAPMSYVSPLDNRVTHASGNNPLRTLCPYELFGVCKDASCTFNHCP